MISGAPGNMKASMKLRPPRYQGARGCADQRNAYSYSGLKMRISWKAFRRRTGTTTKLRRSMRKRSKQAGLPATALRRRTPHCHCRKLVKVRATCHWSRSSHATEQRHETHHAECFADPALFAVAKTQQALLSRGADRSDEHAVWGEL